MTVLRGAALLALVVVTAAAAVGQPLTTVFTYQGALSESGQPAAGTYDLRFRLYTAAEGGAQVGPELCLNNVVVVDGRFAAALDFGAVFAGQGRHLEIDVRADTGLPCGDATGYTTLAPRQAMTAVPNAVYAMIAGTAETAANATLAGNSTNLNGQPASFYRNAANLTGTLSDTTLSSNVARLNANQVFTGAVTASSLLNQFTGTFTGAGGGLTNLDASNITTGTLGNARTTGTPNNTPSTLVQRNGSGNFSAAQITATAFVGPGAGITGLDASNITAGTLGNARTTGTPNNTPNTLVLRNSSGNFSAAEITATAFVGSGDGLTSLNASNITAGTLGTARLPSSVVRTNVANAFGTSTNSFAGSVGIGTAAPASRLHVAGPNGSEFRVTDFAPDGVAGTQLTALFLGNGVGPQARFQKAAGGDFSDIGQNAAGDFVIEGDDLVRLTVKTGTGNVGIGTTSPQARLQVAGGQTVLEQEPWQFPSLIGGWVNYGFDYATAAYFKDSVGVVHLRGTIKDGAGQLFTLPVGYRPSARLILTSWSGTVPIRIDILPDGRVFPITAVNNGWLSLDGITFRAD